MRALVIAREAVQDVRNAVEYYELQSRGLGEDFLHKVEVRIQLIHRRPEIFAVEYLDYRRVMIRRFPYAVVYRCDAERVVVYGVFHTSADPGKWKSRVERQPQR